MAEVVIYSRRKYGEPKLPKPKELKGIKQAFSVDWIPKKCRCQCFIKDKDVWIKHRDFGSIDVYGVDIKAKNKFIFNDNFGCLVLQGEAWLRLENLIIDIESKVFPPHLCWNLAEQITGEAGNMEWIGFFERVISGIPHRG